MVDQIDDLLIAHKIRVKMIYLNRIKADIKFAGYFNLIVNYKFRLVYFNGARLILVLGGEPVWLMAYDLK